MSKEVGYWKLGNLNTRELHGEIESWKTFTTPKGLMPSPTTAYLAVWK